MTRYALSKTTINQRWQCFQACSVVAGSGAAEYWRRFPMPPADGENMKSDRPGSFLHSVVSLWHDSIRQFFLLARLVRQGRVKVNTSKYRLNI